MRGRNAVALEVLAMRAPPVVVASPPPVIVTRPVVVDPVVVVPAYRPAPRYYVPPPGFSIRIGIR